MMRPRSWAARNARRICAWVAIAFYLCGAPHPTKGLHLAYGSAVSQDIFLRKRIDIAVRALDISSSMIELTALASTNLIPYFYAHDNDTNRGAQLIKWTIGMILLWLSLREW